MIGKIFKRLTVISFAGKDANRNRIWLCKCQCGKEIFTRQERLLSGKAKSCGCWRKDRGYLFNLKHGQGYGTKAYKRWSSMKSRCYDPQNASYERYGGRGIKVCERWLHSFENFLSDMGYPPMSMTLERNNTNKDYEPSNCKWASPKEQANNRTNNKRIIFCGLIFTIAQLAERFKMPDYILRQRLKYGWPIETALNVPIRAYRRPNGKITSS